MSLKTWFFTRHGVEGFKGDMLQFETVESALEGIKYVYHLSRGDGQTWADYQKSDENPIKNQISASSW